MNKDVIYIEPEDDITDIITKIENAKEKIIALVPPKKAGILRSVVNIKLLVKAGTSAKKTIVLVTTDPSIMKIAGSVRLPVTKDLQTAPTIPGATKASEIETTSKEELKANLGEKDAEVSEEEKAEAEGDGEEEAGDGKEGKKEGDGETEDSEEADETDDDGAAENADKKGKKSDDKRKDKKKREKTGNKVKDWFIDHKKLAIFGGILGVILIAVLVWALVFAPAAMVTVGIRTNSNNFSEGITFTEKLDEENLEEGKFYLTEEKLEIPSVVEFEATGKKNVGEKATGTVVVYSFFKVNNKGATTVSAGSKFTFSGHTYTADEAVSLIYSGDGYEECDNKSNPSSVLNSGCQISGRVKVTAVEPGESSNVVASNTGWSTSAAVDGVYSDKAMEGGVDKMITIVSQSDIDKAKESLVSSGEKENKEKLIEQIGDKSEDAFILESSFRQSTSEVTSTPAVGEEVKEGVKPKISVTTTATIYTIDETKVKEYITNKAKLSESQKIYEIKDPFIENFLKTDSGYAGKLKTTYVVGPKITENDVVEIVKGKGLGQAQHDIKDIDGVSSMTIDTSYPWVMSIPSDPNKITVILEVQEQ